MNYTGAIKEKWDSRNYLWKHIGQGVAPIDWSKPFKVVDVPSIKDQKYSLSCGGQAFAYYGEVLARQAGLPDVERSAKFIYSQSYTTGGGSAATDLCKTVTNQGWGLETLTPSTSPDGTVTETFMENVNDITQTARDTAKQYEALSYAWVDQTSIDSIAQAIQINNGCVLGIAGNHFAGWTTKFPMSTNPNFWHWLYACGYEMIDGIKYIIVKNSWGNAVGEQGYQWLSESFFTQGNCFGALTLVYNTKPLNDLHHTFNVNMQKGQGNEEIRFLQQILRKEGLFTYPLDTGFYGSATQSAVYKFQQKYNIAPFTRNLFKGYYCGPATRAKLTELYG